MYLEAYIKIPLNTKHWNLIVEIFPHVVFVGTDKIIHSFHADIEQSLHFLRFALRILGIWKYSWQQQELLAKRFITILYRKSL